MFDFLKILKKSRFKSYRVSAQAEVYEQIAAIHHTTAQHVYELAHGLASNGFDDDRIIDTLINRKIICRIR